MRLEECFRYAPYARRPLTSPWSGRNLWVLCQYNAFRVVGYNRNCFAAYNWDMTFLQNFSDLDMEMHVINGVAMNGTIIGFDDWEPYDVTTWANTTMLPPIMLVNGVSVSTNDLSPNISYAPVFVLDFRRRRKAMETSGWGR